MFEFKIAGEQFRPDIALVRQFFETGQMIRLEREPDNAYDANAIKVVWVRPEEVAAKLYHEMAAPPEANHPIDERDVDSVCLPEAFIGYVPRWLAKDVAPILDHPQCPVYTAVLEDPYMLTVKVEGLESDALPEGGAG